MSIENQLKKLVIPFIYVYTLSLGLIFLSAYLIVNKGDTHKSYAQSVEQYEDVVIAINLSKDKDEFFMETLEASQMKLETIDCSNEITRKIDNYFSSFNAPLSGQGCNFYKHAVEVGMDPLIVPAIGMCESTGGKVTPQYQGQESYNAWGWAVYDSIETTKSINAYSCDSWDHCIGRVTRGIHRNSERRHLGTNPEEIVTWYNPGSVNRAGGVPENSTWTQCVEKIIDRIENTPTEL